VLVCGTPARHTVCRADRSAVLTDVFICCTTVMVRMCVNRCAGVSDVWPRPALVQSMAWHDQACESP
jgi:hypothetical protein